MEPDPDPPLAVTRTTTPRPFRASTAEEIKRGTITLTFTRPAESPGVACGGITVILPRGEDETDLVNDDERADSSLIDDYVRDSTGATWTVRRIPRRRRPPPPTGVRHRARSSTTSSTPATTATTRRVDPSPRTPR